MSTNQLPLTAYLPYAPAPDPAAGPRPLAAIIADLSRPIHPRFIGVKEKTNTETGRKVQLHFITWDTAIRILHRYAPGWQSRPHLAMAGDHVVMVYELGIPTADYGVVWRYGDGQNEDAEKSYGEASNRANSQALRRACAMFGLNMDAYDEGGLWAENPDDVVEDAAAEEFAALQAAQQRPRAVAAAAPTPIRIRPAAPGPPLSPKAKPAQVKAITDAFRARQATQSQVAKYLRDLGVDRISELTEGQAADVLADLEGRG